jgi:hypothetical protein
VGVPTATLDCHAARVVAQQQLVVAVRAIKLVADRNIMGGTTSSEQGNQGGVCEYGSRKEGGSRPEAIHGRPMLAVGFVRMKIFPIPYL